MATCPQCGTTYPGMVRICTHDGSVLDADPVDDPQIGKLLDGKYRLDSFLSQGGMGSVYRATHIMLGRTVAVKVIKPELVTSSEIVRRFQREARAASNLNHPNIVGVYDLGQTSDGTLYIAMELIAGSNLKEVIKKTAPMAPDRIVRILVQVASALALAHKHNIIHRDLKPHNIMLATGGPGGPGVDKEVPKLLDFGIAKTFDEAATQLTMTGYAIGTPQYMSPEQAAGKEVDGRTDLYSLGVILYEMLVGEVPFSDASTPAILVKQMTEAPQPPSKRKPEAGVPPALETIALRCLQKDPGNRYQTADELGAALSAADLGGAAKRPSLTAATQLLTPSVAAAVTQPRPTTASDPLVVAVTQPLAGPRAPTTPLVDHAAPTVIASAVSTEIVPHATLDSEPTLHGATTSPGVVPAAPLPAIEPASHQTGTRPTAPAVAAKPPAPQPAAQSSGKGSNKGVLLGLAAALVAAIALAAAVQYGYGPWASKPSPSAPDATSAAPKAAPAMADAQATSTQPSTTPASSVPPSPPDPSATQPSATQPSSTQPSSAQPPASQPSSIQPPATQLPAVQPPSTAKQGLTAQQQIGTREQTTSTERQRADRGTSASPPGAPSRGGSRAAGGSSVSVTAKSSGSPTSAAEPAAAQERPRAAVPENPSVFFRCSGAPEICGAVRSAVTQGLERNHMPEIRNADRAAVTVTANAGVLQDRVNRDFGTALATRTYSVDVTAESREGDVVPMPPPRTFSFDAQYGRDRLDENARLIADDVIERVRAFWSKQKS